MLNDPPIFTALDWHDVFIRVSNLEFVEDGFVWVGMIFKVNEHRGGMMLFLFLHVYRFKAQFLCDESF